MANVYRHYLLDEWFLARWFAIAMFVMLFADKADAERVLAVLGKRLGKYGLQLHPDKTRLVDFRFKPAAQHGSEERVGATTFNFLGFTQVWGRSQGQTRGIATHR